MKWYFIEPRTRKNVKGYSFSSFTRKYKKQLLDTGLDSLKTAFKKAVHKTDEFFRNKIAEAVTNSYDDKIAKTKLFEEIIIPPEEREEILNGSRQAL